MDAQSGDEAALDLLMRQYSHFVRLKASSYFLAGGTSEDLIQEGMIGLYKAARDYKPDKETSFRTFAELCVLRQIITAIKTARRLKHMALNEYVSLASPMPEAGDEATLEGVIEDPITLVDRIAEGRQDLGVITRFLQEDLSPLEKQAVRMFAADYSYEEIAEVLHIDVKAVDNALQRVKRKRDTRLPLNGRLSY